jgi:hypothetical protein
MNEKIVQMVPWGLYIICLTDKGTMWRYDPEDNEWLRLR